MQLYTLLNLIWFSASLLVELIGTLIFAVWLSSRDVDFAFGLGGVPGYLEYRYAVWCSQEGRSPRRAIVLRALLLLNMILAVIYAIPVLRAGAP